MNYLLKSIVFSFFFTAVSCAQNTTIANEMQGFEAQVDSLMQVYHTVGLSVAIVKDGETVYTKGFGYRDYEKKLPVDENTLFGIGSCTKAFTATTLGILKAEGKLSFTDKPSKYIPGLQFYSKEMNDSIQIEHILTHSTGVGNRSSESTAILFETTNVREMIPRIKYLRPAAGVGEEIMYNNLMYTLVGMVGEDITGETWAENIQNKLFDPIGMTQTYPNFGLAAKQDNYSLGYAVDSITPTIALPEQMTTLAPAGAIFSSVNDMSLWLKTWLNQGKVGGKQVIPVAYVSEATSERMLWPYNSNDTTNVTSRYYGYAWLNWIDQGYRRVEHSGGLSGYTSNVVFFPKEKIGLVILTNQTGSGLADSVSNEIISRLLPKWQNDPQEVQFRVIRPILPADSPTIINSELPPTHDLSDFVGKYHHPGFGTVLVTMQGETLYADFPMTKMRLQHNENNEFFDYFTEQVPLIMENFMRLNFQAIDSGKINTLMINLDLEPVAFQKVSD